MTDNEQRILDNVHGAREVLADALGMIDARLEALNLADARASRPMFCPPIQPAAAATVALMQIAQLHDRGAHKHLTDTGSYSLFDEPASVRIALDALHATGAIVVG